MSDGKFFERTFNIPAQEISDLCVKVEAELASMKKESDLMETIRRIVSESKSPAHAFLTGVFVDMFMTQPPAELLDAIKRVMQEKLGGAEAGHECTGCGKCGEVPNNLN